MGEASERAHLDPAKAQEERRTYGTYLKLRELLSLQVPSSDGPEHDEMLFIVIHQVYELWFKQVIHELDLLQRSLEAGDTPPVMATFKRILTIFKTLVAQIDVLETMTPVSFASFRSRLDAASGFQSEQFREMEVILGHRKKGMLQRLPEDSQARQRLAARAAAPSIYDSFLRFLGHRGYAMPADLLSRTEYDEAVEDPRVRAILLDIYRGDFQTQQVCERLVDLDEAVQEWRYRHVKMVERTIGAKRGTGGSAGSKYLRTTLFTPLFPDLWAIRAEL